MTLDMKQMFEATRLTAAGRLRDATALLHDLLPGHRPAADAPRRPAPTADASPSTLRRLRDAFARDRSPLIDLPPARPPAPASGPGQFLAASFSGAAGARPYKVYVPSGYRGQPVPLIVMLHGCTQSPDDFAAGTRMNAVAEAETCLVVYPAQTSAANASKCWNWFTTEHQQRDRGEPAVIAGLTRAVMADYAIDPRRVYAAGLSAGGAAAAVLGEAYPDLYAAIGVHSGLACGSARDLVSALAAMRGGTGGRAGSAGRAGVPVIVFHGDADTTVHPTNGDAVIAAAIGASSITTRVERGRAAGGRTYTRTLHADASGRTTVEQWVVHGGGHAWSGGDAGGSYTDPSGPDASRAMIRFFGEHPLA